MRLCEGGSEWCKIRWTTEAGSVAGVAAGEKGVRNRFIQS
jgi:hypothetical protein